MNGNQIADILVSKIAIYAEANGTSILQAFDDEADALIEYINEVEEVYKPADFKARLTNFVIGEAPLYATDKDYIARFFNAEPVELDEALRGKLAELQACLRKRISKNKRKPAAPESKESEPPKRTPKELAFIDTLDQVDTELRKARQVMHEFYDDIVVCESRYPTFEGIVNAQNADAVCNSSLFKLVAEFPRIATLLEVAADHLSEGHSIVIKALCEAGARSTDDSFVVG